MCIRDRSIPIISGACKICTLPESNSRASSSFCCLLYTSDAADDLTRVDIGGCRFFQAEDGIRDLVRSRGLGDVYKRQIHSYNLGSMQNMHFTGIEFESIELFL